MLVRVVGNEDVDDVSVLVAFVDGRRQKRSSRICEWRVECRRRLLACMSASFLSSLLPLSSTRSGAFRANFSTFFEIRVLSFPASGGSRTTSRLGHSDQSRTKYRSTHRPRTTRKLAVID